MDDDRLATGFDALLDSVARESEEITARARTGLTDPIRARQEIDLLSWQVDATVAFLRTRASRLQRRGNPTGLRLIIPHVIPHFIPHIAATPRQWVLPLAVLGLVAGIVATAWWATPRSVPEPGRTVAPVALPPAEPPAASTADVESRPPARSTGTAGRTIEPSAPLADAPRSAAESEVVAAAEGWLDAYFRQDQQGMATVSAPGVQVSDERAAQERLPPGTSGARRAIEGATVQHHGTGAVLTAKMIETGVDPVTSQAMHFEAFISQMWTRRGGAWQLHETRIVSAAAVSRAFRR